MPTYEYVCEKCGHEFELIQSMVDKALSICPKAQCHQKPWGRGKVKRKISLGGGLIFKGSGFYSTDYRSDNYKAGAKKENESQIKTPTGDKAAGGDKGTGGTTTTPAKSESKTPAASPPKTKA